MTCIHVKAVNERIERRYIGKGRSIIVVIRGSRMGKRGPKRKEGKREASGRLERGTYTERLNEMNRQQTKAIRSVALAQPHRRGDEDEWLALAAGRFCRRHRLDARVHSACGEYQALERRWMAGYGAPKGYEQHSGGSGRGPSDVQMKQWRETLNKIQKRVVAVFGFEIYSAMRRLCVEDVDVFEEPSQPLISALYEMAILTDFVENNPHPFRSCG